MSESDPVGYGRPPKIHQFQKGKSGNPSGRPKRTAATDLEYNFTKRDGMELVNLMDRPVKVMIGGKLRRLYPYEVQLIAMAKKGLQGDLRSIRFVFREWIKADAFQTPVKYGVHVKIPLPMPSWVGDQLVDRYGAPPWSPKIIKEVLAEYREIRSPKDAEIDTAMGHDLYKDDYYVKSETPAASRFTPGISGNPRGRPRRAVSNKTIAQKIAKMKVTIDGKRMNMVAALVRVLRSLANKGNVSAAVEMEKLRLVISDPALRGGASYIIMLDDDDQAAVVKQYQGYNEWLMKYVEKIKRELEGDKTLRQ